MLKKILVLMALVGLVGAYLPSPASAQVHHRRHHRRVVRRHRRHHHIVHH